MDVVSLEEAGRFSAHRVGAVMIRQAYLYRRTLHRWLEIFYWPVMELLVFGFLSLYLRENPDTSAVAAILLGALLL